MLVRLFDKVGGTVDENRQNTDGGRKILPSVDRRSKIIPFGVETYPAKDPFNIEVAKRLRDFSAG